LPSVPLLPSFPSVRLSVDPDDLRPRLLKGKFLVERVFFPWYELSVRLSNEQVADIRESVHRRDSSAVVYLFGSQTDDRARGGDIDLLVLSPRLTAEDRRRIKLDLYKRVGHRKIDLLVASDTRRPFVRLALEKGVRL
jgi:uncharacterized protein